MRNNPYYLIRLDDACPTMNRENWERIEKILDNYSIKPMVGIIPNNNDTQLLIDEYDPFFWTRVQSWQEKGWTIALHGSDHVCLTKSGGINPVHKRSEFAGLSLKEQEEKIEKGLSILNDHNLNVNYFFAPSHTFDKNTIRALLNKTNIRRISDTMARFPYTVGDMIIYPQQFGYFRNVNIAGFWTFCFHPNLMNEKMFFDFENFIKNNSTKFISFDNIDLKLIKNKSLIDKCLSLIYFIFRKMRKYKVK